jgi:hypothetical protein
MIEKTYENMQSLFDRRVTRYVENGELAIANAECAATTEMRTDYRWMLRDVYGQ